MSATDPVDHRYGHPLAEFLQMSVEEQGPHAAVTRLEVTGRHHNVNGFLHGAVAFALVDVAMGAAVLAGMDDDRTCASSDVHLRFLRSVTSGRLEARAEVEHRGRRTVTLRAEVTCDGRRIASGTGAFAILEPRPERVARAGHPGSGAAQP